MSRLHEKVFCPKDFRKRVYLWQKNSETGKTAQEYIQIYLINVAKEKILDPDKSISQVAYELGFQYPQHFTRMFKKVTGMTPNHYRTIN